MTTRSKKWVNGVVRGACAARAAASSRGAVIVEFALAFPMLLITFVFVCQVLNVFTYDILGSYAAYAAARSYAVNRNAGWDEGEFDLDAAREAAARKAYGIVVAIMATYSMPSGTDERLPAGWTADKLGIDEFVESAETFRVFIPDSSYYAAHRRLHANFRIVEYSDELPVEIQKTPGDLIEFNSVVAGTRDQTLTIPMKEGYGYPENDPPGPDDEPAPWYQWFVDNVIQPIGELFGFAEREYVAFPMKVAQIAFVYDYPTVLTHAAGRYLSPGFAGQRPLRIGVYQSCGMPIEPMPSAFADELDDVEVGRTQEEVEAIEEETKRKEDAIDAALDALYDCIKEIKDTLEGDRPDRENWSDHPPWNIAAGREHDLEIVRVNPVDHQALTSKEEELTHLMLQYEPDPPPDDAPDECAIADHIENNWGNPNNEEVWLLDPRESLLADRRYRKKVQGWIQEEINYLTGEINRLSREQDRHERRVSSNEDKIKAENKKEKPDQDLISELEDKNRELDSKIGIIDGEIRVLEDDKAIWETRHGGEQEIIDHNQELIDGCLKENLRNVEKKLSEYYKFVQEKMKEDSEVLDGFQGHMQ